MRPLQILTWHIHGSYLYYLSQVPHDIFVPKKVDGTEGYAGRTSSYPWPDNLHEIPAEEVKNLDLDCIVFQSRQNYLEDQHEILTETQRNLTHIYLEHDPPREHPTDTKHLVDDPSVLLVHVTAFNDLMWDNNQTPTCVIDHGVMVPKNVRYSGELKRGIVVINNIRKRGRRLGSDIYDRAREVVPLDYVGMGWQEAGGIGEVAHHKLPGMEAHYRFFFNPIRYTSLGLAVCEAMMIGMPIVGMATTEMVTVIENGVSGYLNTQVPDVIDFMKYLLDDPVEARSLSEGARRTALERFNIQRFVDDWNRAFASVTGTKVWNTSKRAMSRGMGA